MVTDRRCPRCGAARPDDFRWCRKCGLDYQNPPKTVVPDSNVLTDPRPTSSAPTEPARVDVRRVNDRANMAQLSRDAVDVRCLGTIGGLVGALVGFIAFAWIGSMIGGAGVLLAFVGIPFGWWLGVRTALGLIAK